MATGTTVIRGLRGSRLWLGRLRVVVAMPVILGRTLTVPVAVLLVLFVCHLFPFCAAGRRHCVLWFRLRRLRSFLDMSAFVQNHRRSRGDSAGMAELAPSEAELAELRRQMLAHAYTRVPPSDAEDVTQDALLRLVGDRRPTTEKLRTRGFRKLKDVHAERFRRRQNQFEADAEPLEEVAAEIAPQEAMINLIALEEQIAAEAGIEVLQYAKAKAAGLTNKELAADSGWDPNRVEAARKQLSRKSEAIARAIEGSEPLDRREA